MFRKALPEASYRVEAHDVQLSEGVRPARNPSPI